MTKEVFVKTELSRTHKNHCVRATAITFWSDAEIPNQHIQQISGHKSKLRSIMTTAYPLSSWRNAQTSAVLVTTLNCPVNHSLWNESHSASYRTKSHRVKVSPVSVISDSCWHCNRNMFNTYEVFSVQVNYYRPETMKYKFLLNIFVQFYVVYLTYDNEETLKL